MNIPNKISIFRICLIPVFLFFFLSGSFIPYSKIIATFLLILACVSDAVDGHIARKYNMVTDLGKLLDPVADKVFALSALLVIVVDGTIPHPFGIIVFFTFILRDFLIGGLRQIAASKKFVISADKWGKIKAIFFYVSLVALFILSFLLFDMNYELTNTWILVYAIFCYTLIGVATILNAYSGINYLIKNKDVFQENVEKNQK